MFYFTHSLFKNSSCKTFLSNFLALWITLGSYMKEEESFLHTGGVLGPLMKRQFLYLSVQKKSLILHDRWHVWKDYHTPVRPQNKIYFCLTVASLSKKD